MLDSKFLNKYPDRSFLTELPTPTSVEFGDCCTVSVTQSVTLVNFFESSDVSFLVIPKLSVGILFGQTEIIKFNLLNSPVLSNISQRETVSKEIQVTDVTHLGGFGVGDVSSADLTDHSNKNTPTTQVKSEPPRDLGSGLESNFSPESNDPIHKFPNHFKRPRRVRLKLVEPGPTTLCENTAPGIVLGRGL
jgi:hypothetical protein